MGKNKNMGAKVNDKHQPNIRKFETVRWLFEEVDDAAFNDNKFTSDIGSLSDLNTGGRILKNVGHERLSILSADLMELLHSSIAIFEENGDYAFADFSSSWCHFMFHSSYKLCQKSSLEDSLSSGKWLCHEDCWNRSAEPAIRNKEATDILCAGGVHLYAEPIFVDNRSIGAINIAYGTPGTDIKKIQHLSEKFDVSFDELILLAGKQKYIPLKIEENVKKRLKSVAYTIGELVRIKECEILLRENEAQLEALFEQAAVGIAKVNTQSGRFERINERYAQITGYTREELTQRDFVSITHPDDVDEGLENMQKLKEGSIREFRMQKRYIHKKGRIIWVELNVTPMWKTGEIPGHHIAAISDITAQKQAENIIKQNIEQLNRSQSLAKVGCYETDLTTNTWKASREFIAIFGLPAKEIYTVDEFVALIHPDDVEEVMEFFKLCINEKKPFNTIYRCKKYDTGQIIYVESKSECEYNKNGKAIRAFGVKMDITDHILAETALKNSEKKLEEVILSKDKFFSIIAHDLKTPFNGILGFSDLLQYVIEKKDYDKIKQYGQLIQTSANNAVNLLNNLLDWSRSQLGRIKFQPEKISLHQVIRDVVSQQESLALRKSVEINIAHFPEWHIYADPNMLRTILRNLISNAVKYTPAGGKVGVYVIKLPASIKVMVEDTGVGIPPDAAKTLLELESDYSTLDTDGHKGTGLGLIMCREFVEKHGGTIDFESKVGKGSIFWFTLPLS